MKEVLSTSINASRQQPFLKKTHEWYNAMVQETAVASVQSQIPSALWTSNVIVLYGCVFTGDQDKPTACTAGAVWYNGKMYKVDAVTGLTYTGLNVGFWSVTSNTGLSEALVKFTDENQYDVHFEQKMTVVSATTGVQVTEETRRLEYIQFNKSKELYEMITLLKISSDDFFTDYFDANGVGLSYNKYEGFCLCTDSSQALALGAVDMAGITTVGINFKDTPLADVRQQSSDGGSTNETTYYKKTGTWTSLIGDLIGKWKHALLDGEIPSGVMWGNRSGGPSGGYEEGGQFSPHINNEDGNNEPHENRQPSRIAVKIMKVAEIA